MGNVSFGVIGLRKGAPRLALIRSFLLFRHFFRLFFFFILVLSHDILPPSLCYSSPSSPLSPPSSFLLSPSSPSRPASSESFFARVCVPAPLCYGGVMWTALSYLEFTRQKTRLLHGPGGAATLLIAADGGIPECESRSGSLRRRRPGTPPGRGGRGREGRRAGCVLGGARWTPGSSVGPLPSRPPGRPSWGCFIIMRLCIL